MAKPRTKQARTSAPTLDGVLDRALTTLNYGLTHIEKELVSIVSGKAKANGHDKGSRIAFLTARVGAIADSVRKVEAARAKRLEQVTHSIVVAWARELAETDLARLIADLEQLNTKRSGLS